MKSSQSCFNCTLFRKNITRFAPVWGIYQLCLLMGLFILADNGHTYHFADNMAECIQIMSVVNFGYALVCALVLFGDLYNTRMCYAIHSLPMRREEIFLTNIVSGLLFSFVPTAVMTLCSLPIMAGCVVANGWQVCLYWLLAANLQYLFFFGVAVLCAMFAGNRLGLGIAYTLVNFLSLLIGWMVNELYVPMMSGLTENYTAFEKFCPVGHIAGVNFIRVEATLDKVLGRYVDGIFSVTENWGYLWLCAWIGIAAVIAALLLYRRRHLESAGDLIAVPALEPVFYTLFALLVGVGFHFVLAELVYQNNMLFPVVGLVTGSFTGRMLLERNVRVFTKKNFLRTGILAAALGLSILAAAVDPLGITRWVPEKEQVKAVGLSLGSGYYADDDVTVTDPQDIEQILALHRDLVGQKKSGGVQSTVCYDESHPDMCRAFDITLHYMLASGKTADRTYMLTLPGSGDGLVRFYNMPQAIFGSDYPDLASIARTAYLTGSRSEQAYDALEGADLTGLFEAMAKDCENGTMAQYYPFGADSIALVWLYFTDSGGRSYDVSISDNDVYSLEWLGTHGVDLDLLFEGAEGAYWH